MNLNHLRVFHSVATHMSFTRAADELCLTQPGISKHVKQLESHYGVRLFDRLGRKVVLTQAGEILLETTRTLFELLQGADERIRELSGLKGGRLKLGASVTMGICFLPRILRTFTVMYPGVDVSLDIDLSRMIEGKVLRNAVDVGLIGAPSHDGRLVEKTFLTDRLLVITAPTHKWAKRLSVTPQELMGERFVLSGKGSGTRSFLEERFGAAGIVLTNTLEFGNTEGVKKAVENGLGISIVSSEIVERELKAGLINGLLLDGMNLERHFSYVYRKDKYLTPAARRFLELL